MRAPARFAVRVPPSWYEVDLERAATADLARTVDARLATCPELARHRGVVLRVLRDASADAERRGGVLCAVMAEADGAGGLLLITAMGFVTAGSPDPERNTTQAIAAELAAGSPGSVQAVQLSAGRGVRVQGVWPLTVDAGRTLDCVSMQTVIPVPGDGTFVNLVLTSPNVDLAEPLLDLFDAVSSTLRWLDHPDPATAPE